MTSHIKANQDRVVVTGIGVVSSIGIGKDEFWKGLKEGRSGIKPVTLFDTSTTNSKLAGEISDFKPELILGEKGLRNLDRTTKLALCAAKLALDDGKFEVSDSNSDNVGVVLGSTMGSVWSISEFDKEALRNGPRAVNPALFPNTVINSPASQISIRFGIKGFNTTISTGFSSALDALDYAKNFILLGRAKVVLVGGVEELCEQTFKGFYKTGFLSGSRDATRELMAPFDRRRNGAVLGEGSSMFILEELDHARDRGAKIYGELKGSSSFFNGRSYYRYDLKAEAMKRAISGAIEEAGILANEIDYVSSSANSTLDGDVSEVRALQASISGRKIIASSIKSMIGESYSAGAAFQLASSFLTLQENVIPPTINYEAEDRRCQIDCVPNTPKEQEVNNILVCTQSPMGQNSAVVLSGVRVGH